MKRILLSILAIATISLTSLAQAPEGFKYQAVVRDAGNLILNNQAVGMQLTILQGSTTGTAVYTETFASSTNAYGLVNLEIGSGTTADDFTTIDWANGPFYMETAVDVTGGTNYSVMGTSQLMSVPYALYAKTSGNGAGPVGPVGPAGTNGVDGVDGATGPQGPAGTNGVDGVDGATGPMGPQGPAGLNGADGVDGLDGATGPMGPQGPAGANGLDGATGPMGPQGPAGLNGVDGLDGATGPMGPQGPAGANGVDGATGPMGPQGPVGATGPAGSGNDFAYIRSHSTAANNVNYGILYSYDPSPYHGLPNQMSSGTSMTINTNFGITIQTSGFYNLSWGVTDLNNTSLNSYGLQLWVNTAPAPASWAWVTKNIAGGVNSMSNDMVYLNAGTVVELRYGGISEPSVNGYQFIRLEKLH